MNKEELKKYKEILLKNKEEIIEKLSQIATRDSDGDYTALHEEYGSADEDNATELADQLDKNSLINSFVKDLKQYEKALKKIENGTYGKCDHCSEEIDKKRLEYFPSALYCSSCQRKIEKDVI
ncbi:TraR/DksA C4-type zinc finger protein [Patescibacteria group bacterium]|nr:TraR/DksA C4-type zinc finger protein [Patescibacteria group bacterium]